VTKGLQDPGQRPPESARVVTAVCAHGSAAGHHSPGGEALRIAGQILRRRAAAGGAGQCSAGEDIPRPADLVTDDERDGLIGRDADRRAAAEG
jgi:hypothetical protein